MTETKGSNSGTSAGTIALGVFLGVLAAVVLVFVLWQLSQPSNLECATQRADRALGDRQTVDDACR